MEYDREEMHAVFAELGEELQAVHRQRTDVMKRIREALLLNESTNRPVPLNTAIALTGIARQTAYDAIKDPKNEHR